MSSNVLQLEYNLLTDKSVKATIQILSDVDSVDRFEIEDGTFKVCFVSAKDKEDFWR